MLRGIAQQFGLATIPVFSSARSPFTSGTTSGTPSSKRNADDLSIHNAPAAAAGGTICELGSAPTEKKQRSKSPPLRAAALASSSSNSPSIWPAVRQDANVRMFLYPRSEEELERDTADSAAGADDSYAGSSRSCSRAPRRPRGSRQLARAACRHSRSTSRTMSEVTRGEVVTVIGSIPRRECCKRRSCSARLR